MESLQAHLVCTLTWPDQPIDPPFPDSGDDLCDLEKGNEQTARDNSHLQKMRLQNKEHTMKPFQ